MIKNCHFLLKMAQKSEKMSIFLIFLEIHCFESNIVQITKEVYRSYTTTYLGDSWPKEWITFLAKLLMYQEPFPTQNELIQGRCVLLVDNRYTYSR